MPDSAPPRRVTLVCSCEDTMPLDEPRLAAACTARGEALRTGEQLCRAQLDRVLAALDAEGATVACTQEAPLFAQEAEAAGRAGALSFLNLRELAGWSDEAERAGPKMAALLAAHAEPVPPTALVPLRSEGVCLLLGRDGTALEAATRLAETLDLTVLLTGEEAVQPLARAEFPVLRGRAAGARGHLGAFEVSVDGVAAPAPSSRAEYRWGPARDGTTSRCDLILDLSGGPALFPAHELRLGYLRAEPADAAAVERAVAAARDLVGAFDKPRFVAYEAGLCAHARNRRTGCTRCLDLCPTGAIVPAGEGVAISAEICAGCGACAAVCPTGAATYALPPPETTARRARALLRAYDAAGGPAHAGPAVLLVHPASADPLLDALARQGDGLPARVLPLRVNEAGALDLGLLAAALAWGASALRVLLPARRGHGSEGVLRNLGFLEAALEGLGRSGSWPRAAAIETDDPFSLGEALRALPREPALASESFLALGRPRELIRPAFSALAGGRPAVAPLPPLAPLGLARVEAAGCTLCLACTMVCPTGAFSASPEAPRLSFTEEACVQCGLCVATCPERVISLEPRLNLAPEASRAVVVKEEAPFPCARCGKPFGTRSSVERVRNRLAASGHWMFRDPSRLAVLEMCEDCRVFAATDGGLDPYAGPERPAPRTTEDWLRERGGG